MTGGGRVWTTADVPDQTGRVAVITGASRGIGFETARILARAGAKVVVAARRPERVPTAATRIAGAAADADVETVRLDLADLSSVRAAAEEIRARFPVIDLLVNNAGVMWVPRTETADGFESQFGTNHLGHFAFTGLLLDRLLPAPRSRVVTVSSLFHRLGRVHFADPQLRERYSLVRGYAQSKRANLLFAVELGHRLRAADARTGSTGAHPGACRTRLSREAPASFRWFNATLGGLLLQSPAMGALPVVRAAVDQDGAGGDWFHPRGPGRLRGFPVQGRFPATSEDERRRLWSLSERLTGVRFPV